MLYHVWRESNARIFRHVRCTEDKVIFNINEYIRFKFMRLGPGFVGLHDEIRKKWSISVEKKISLIIRRKKENGGMYFNVLGIIK